MKYSVYHIGLKDNGRSLIVLMDTKEECVVAGIETFYNDGCLFFNKLDSTGHFKVKGLISHFVCKYIETLDRDRLIYLFVYAKDTLLFLNKDKHILSQQKLIQFYKRLFSKFKTKYYFTPAEYAEHAPNQVDDSWSIRYPYDPKSLASGMHLCEFDVMHDIMKWTETNSTVEEFFELSLGKREVKDGGSFMWIRKDTDACEQFNVCKVGVEQFTKTINLLMDADFTRLDTAKTHTKQLLALFDNAGATSSVFDFAPNSESLKRKENSSDASNATKVNCLSASLIKRKKIKRNLE